MPIAEKIDGNYLRNIFRVVILSDLHLLEDVI
jgi:hypothetical protein